MSVSSSQISSLSSTQKRYQQIDVVKGIAIVAVLLLHALENEALVASFAIYHIWQAVPFFMIVMGLNTGFSTTSRKLQLSRLYTRTYFKSKAYRILLPLLLVYIISIVAGYIWLILQNENRLEFNAYGLIGLLPIPGPGNYFVTLILQSVFFLPVIGYWFQRRPLLTVVLLVILEVLFLLWSNHLGFLNEEKYLYSAAFPRYFAAIAFGLALSKVVVHPVKWMNMLVLLVIAAAGGIILHKILFMDFDFGFIRPEWQTQHVLTFGYAAFLILIFFRLLPQSSENRLLRLIAALGKASYHIFLIQIVYFGLLTTSGGVLQGMMICLLLGYLFFRLDNKYFFGFTA
jgi:peptidoglycan/LPS O-acetylase OafA/YrhL